MPSNSENDRFNIVYWYGYNTANLLDNYEQTLSWNGAAWTRNTNNYYLSSTTAASKWFATVYIGANIDFTNKGYTEIKTVSSPSIPGTGVGTYVDVDGSISSLTGVHLVGTYTGLTGSKDNPAAHSLTTQAVWLN